MTVSVTELRRGEIDPVLINLIEKVDNIYTPTIDELKELLNKNAKVLQIKSGSDVVANFFTDIDGDTLVLECMLGKSINGVDPCVILIEYAEREAKRLNLKRLRINTKRKGVVIKFLKLGFDSVQFVVEKEIQNVI